MQFEALQQGNMTVAEYTSEFTRLSRFAENLVRAPEDRAWRFKKGLTRELRHAVAISQATTYASILKIAQAVEKEADPKLKRDRDIGSNSYQMSAKRTQIQARPQQPAQAASPSSQSSCTSATEAAAGSYLRFLLPARTPL
ncbi:Uncharacterized protein M6B38_243010 [Iris pallida]|uniref:Retrotransposon gag domain-containing protein n=1 Tax=Iris pallida TaxID=29817 RepID=A0AAX6DJV9_IRIPA|nr:Uncharacterized protein M6B38_243010 [Iris pallida]